MPMTKQLREQMRYGDYIIAKEPIPGFSRRYRAVVMLVGSNRIVFRAYRQNWTRASRQECRGWIATEVA